MELMDAIRQRHSVRRYERHPVEAQKLQAILEAARLAPSARNRQDWRFVVVLDQHIKDQLVEAAKGQQFVAEAGAVIAACAIDPHTMSCGVECGPVDVAIAVTNMTLKAVEEGLGTCWIGAFHQDKVKEILEIPQEATVVELITLGYPAEEPSATPRMDLDEIVCYDTWSF